MAKVTWTISPERVAARIRGIAEELEGGIVNVVEDATKEGAEAMQEAIEQDTQTTWVGHGPYAEIGRQDYGGFRKDIKHDVKEYKTSARGTYGWTQNKEDYYMYQEHGFRHWITERWIPGVKALYHGGERAKAKVIEGISNLFKGMR